MTGLEKILSGIKEEAEAKAKEILDGAASEAAKFAEDTAKEAEGKASEIKKQGQAKAADIKKRGDSAADLIKRKTLLSAKQEIISSIFDEAYDKLLKLDGAAYNDFCIKVAVKNAQDKWVCPVPGVSSSSVTPPSSSSVVPPSSSSQESSSSVEPPPPSSSSQGPIEITAPGTLAEANQEYSMTHSCGTEFQFSPPQNNGSCSVVINGETIAIGYYKNYPTSPGTYILKSDCGGVTVRCY